MIQLLFGFIDCFLPSSLSLIDTRNWPLNLKHSLKAASSQSWNQISTPMLCRNCIWRGLLKFAFGRNWTSARISTSLNSYKIFRSRFHWSMFAINASRRKYNCPLSQIFFNSEEFNGIFWDRTHVLVNKLLSAVKIISTCMNLLTYNRNFPGKSHF